MRKRFGFRQQQPGAPRKRSEPSSLHILKPISLLGAKRASTQYHQERVSEGLGRIQIALFNSHIEQHTSTYRKDGGLMINKGFPTFGTTQDGVHLSTLKNYNLPDFILKMVAAECDSELLEKGRMDDRLQSMNEDALKMLYRIFVDCEDDDAGRFAQYRFYAYISSAFHKCEILVDESIPGESQKNHKFPVAVKNKGMYIAVAYNKSTGNPISKREVGRFYDMVDDVKRGEHGTMLSEAVYGSSVDIKKDAIEELRALSAARPDNDENRVNFRVANFENSIYLVTKC